MGRKGAPSTRTIKVFHGLKHWTKGSKVYAPCINYFMARGMIEADAFEKAKTHLTYLRDFTNRPLLEAAMLNAQRSGIYSPFVSTSTRRSIARSFALEGDTRGFILTIQGPEDQFYDFNQIRSDNGIPHPSEFHWLYELGIPLVLAAPFEVIEVDEVEGVIERKKVVYRKRKRR